VRVDALAIRLRPRTAYEAADLGATLCQSAWRDVYRCYAAVALPVFALCIAASEFSTWLPAVALWWLKPWLDRTILFVLSRAAFGQRTSLSDLWQAQRQVWWSQLILTLTWRRLSPWRSFTQPVYQLEGLSFRQIRQRVRQIRRNRGSTAFFVTATYSTCETCLTLAIFSLLYWFSPLGHAPDFLQFFTGEEGAARTLMYVVAYAIVLLFLEPFYVGAGFGMYLSRRAELEAWDIEQEFRRAFGS
jgi:hypothetical protein